MENKNGHRLNPRIKGMKCLKCGKEYPAGDYFYGCPSCLEAGENASLTFIYEGDASIQEQEKGMKRYGDFLPYSDTVTLGEGQTPLLCLPALAEELGLAGFYTKNEFQNPTGSHKDRMNPFITARAKEAGYQTVTCASSGNEAASLAAYAAAEGLRCINVSTEDIPFVWKNASDASGAELVLAQTSADRLSYQRANMDEGWYCATNLLDIPVGSSPFGIQGYKTLAFELYEQMGEALPDCVLIPTCRGDLLYGVYEGFHDLLLRGMINRMPRLAACEPFPRLELVLRQGRDHRDKFTGDSSKMDSIGGKTATWQSVYALRETEGFAVSPVGMGAEEAMLAMGRHGLFLESSSAVVYPCVKQALRLGYLQPEQTVLAVLTSNGYKSELRLGTGQ